MAGMDSWSLILIRTAGRGVAAALRSFALFDFDSVLQFVEAAQRDDLPRLDALHGGRASISGANRHVLYRSRLVRLNHVDERLLRVPLYCLRWNKDDVVLRFDQQFRVHELVWKERVIFVFEDRP